MIWPPAGVKTTKAFLSISHERFLPKSTASTWPQGNEPCGSNLCRETPPASPQSGPFWSLRMARPSSMVSTEPWLTYIWWKALTSPQAIPHQASRDQLSCPQRMSCPVGRGLRSGPYWSSVTFSGQRGIANVASQPGRERPALFHYGKYLEIFIQAKDSVRRGRFRSPCLTIGYD